MVGDHEFFMINGIYVSQDSHCIYSLHIEVFSYRYIMYPISLYLGFASSIIWVEQVQILTLFSAVLSYLLRVIIVSILPYGGKFKLEIVVLSLLWVHQGTYLTHAARSHARDNNLHEGTTIGNFNGEFWGMFACRQVNRSVAAFSMNNIWLHSRVCVSFLVIFNHLSNIFALNFAVRWKSFVTCHPKRWNSMCQYHCS